MTISDLLPVMEKATSVSGVRSRIGGSGNSKVVEVEVVEEAVSFMHLLRVL